MSRAPPEKYVVLKEARFHELCGFLALKGQCCSDPDRKVIERGFRKKALKCHPDKGGDAVEFKKVNDAYNRLIGHITKLETLNEETELSCNSIIIEISKVAVPKWRDKLKKCYGVPKCDNVKNLVFEGPYEQFRGRSNHTGPITVVLYIDPEDCIPKLHIQADKYMAWITEQRMPLHLHVDKGRQIQFDQWRICHLAEFGLCTFMSNAHMAPPPTPTPKPKRKAREKNTEPKPKTRRDSTPKEKEEAQNKEDATDTKSSSESKKTDSSNVHAESGKPDEIDADWEEVIENPNDPKPQDIEEQTFVKNGKRYRKKSANQPKPKEAKSFENKPFTCGQCGTGYNDCGDYSRHKQMCIPDEEFNEEMRDYFKPTKEESKNQAEDSSMDVDVDNSKNNMTKTKSLSPIREELRKPVTTPSEPPAFTCKNCNSGYSSEVTFKRHTYVCKLTKSTNSKLKQKSSTETDTNLSDLSSESSSKTVQNSCEHDLGENGDVKKDKMSMDSNDMYAMIGKLNESIHDDNKSDIKANAKPSSKGQNSRPSQISETHKTLDTNINIPNNVQSKDKISEPSAPKLENITLTELSRKPNGCELPSDNPVHPHSKQIRMSESDPLTPKATQHDNVATNGEHKQSNLKKDNSPSAKLGQKITNGIAVQKTKDDAQEVPRDSKINKKPTEPKIETKTSKNTKPWRQSNPEITKFNVDKVKIPTNSNEKVPEKAKSTLDKNPTTLTKEKQLDEFEIISQTCNKVTAPAESTDEKVKIDKEEKMQMDISKAYDTLTKPCKVDQQNQPIKEVKNSVKMEVDEPNLEKNFKTLPPKDDKIAQTTNSSFYSKPSGIQMASHTTLEQENEDSSDLQQNTASSISQTRKEKVNVSTTDISTKEQLYNTSLISAKDIISTTSNTVTQIKSGASQSSKETKPTTPSTTDNAGIKINGFSSPTNKDKINGTNSTPTTGHQSQINGFSSKTIKDNVTSTNSIAATPVPQKNGLASRDKIISLGNTPTKSSASHQSNGVSLTTSKSKMTTTTTTTSARGAQLKTPSLANQKPTDSAQKIKPEAQLPENTFTTNNSISDSLKEKETTTKTLKGLSSISNVPVAGKYSSATKSTKQLDKKALDVSNDILSSKPKETKENPNSDRTVSNIKSISQTPTNSPKTAKHLDKKAIDVSNIIFRNKESLETATTTINSAPVMSNFSLNNTEPEGNQKQTTSNKLSTVTTSSKAQPLESEVKHAIIEAKQCYVVNVPVKASNLPGQKENSEDINHLKPTNNLAKNVTVKRDTNDAARVIDPVLNKYKGTQAETLHTAQHKKVEEILPSNIMWNRYSATMATEKCVKGISAEEANKTNSPPINPVKLINSALDDRQKPLCGPGSTNAAPQRPVNCGLSRFEAQETRTSISNIQPRTSQYASQWANTSSPDTASGKSIPEINALHMTTNYMKQHHDQPTKVETPRESQSTPTKSYNITPTATNTAPKPYIPSSYSKTYETPAVSTTSYSSSTTSYSSEPFTPALSRRTIQLSGLSKLEDREPLVRSKTVADNLTNNFSKFGASSLSGSKSNVHFSEPAITASHRYPSSSSTYKNPLSHIQFSNTPISPPVSNSSLLSSSSSIKPTPSAYQSTPAKYKGAMSNSANITSLTTPSVYQTDHCRAKSEGSGLTSNTSSVSRGNSELFKEIQKTKDLHRENYDQAMRYTNPLPPRTPMLSQKFPRPESSTYKPSTLDRREKKG